jgi:hypothetical protein
MRASTNLAIVVDRANFSFASALALSPPPLSSLSFSISISIAQFGFRLSIFLRREDLRARHYEMGPKRAAPLPAGFAPVGQPSGVSIVVSWRRDAAAAAAAEEHDDDEDESPIGWIDFLN